MPGTKNSGHTEKELLALRDELEAEALTIKKLTDYKENINDPEIGSMVNSMIEKHKGHYNKLLGHIK